MSWGQEPPESGPDRGQDPASGGWGENPPPPGASNDRGSAPQSDWGDDPPTNRLRPLNLGDVLDGMFRLAIAHWRAFTIALGVIVVPLALLSTLAVTLAFGTAPGFFEMLNDPDVAEGFVEGSVTTDDFAGITSAFGALAVAGLAGLLLTPMLYGVAVHVAAVGYRSGDIDPIGSVRAAARRYFPLLGATILLGLVPLLIFLAPLVLVIIGAVTGADALAVVGTIGFLVSLVFAVIAAIRLAVTIPAVVIEGTGPIQALRRSNELVKGKTGLTLGTLLVVYIIVTIIGLVLSLPFSLVAGAVGNTGGAVVETVSQIVSSLVQNALLGGAVVLIYFDRRVRTEGYDLTELASELGERRDRPW